VLYTTCCGPGTFLVLTGPGRVGGGQLPAASQPPGAIIGFRASDAIGRLADRQYVVLTSRGVYITTDITATPVVWTPLPGSPANACAVSVADTAGRPGTPTLYIQSGICNERTMGLKGDQLWRYVGTTPGGTWTRIDDTDGQTGGVGIFAVDASNSNRLYASNMNAAGPRMVFSTDAGLHWTADPNLNTLMNGNGDFRYTTQRGPGNFSTNTPGVDGAVRLFYPLSTLVAFDP